MPTSFASNDAESEDHGSVNPNDSDRANTAHRYHSFRNRVAKGTIHMSVIHLEIDDDFAELLGSSPEQIERSALEMIVLELYRRRELSAGRAAEFLNLDKFAFIRWAGEHGVPYFDMTPEEWQQELRAIDKA